MSPAADAVVPTLAACQTPTAPADDAFERCAESLYRFVLIRVGGDTHLADDVMQQLWLHWRRGRAVPPEQAEFWLRSIARNLVRTHWRRTARYDARVSADLAERVDREPLPAEMLERAEVREQLLLAITALPHEHQSLIVEHYFDGLPHDALAARHGLTPRAIEGKLYRARAALREALRKAE
ncbi:MAG: sigma-70 family RNA polymerase sigma factor [Phycisphaerae bacterium]